MMNRRSGSRWRSPMRCRWPWWVRSSWLRSWCRCSPPAAKRASQPVLGDRAIDAMHEPLSQKLVQMLEANSRSDGVTLNHLLERTEGRGFYLVVILLSLPFILPVSIPGVSTVLGLAVAVLSFKLAFGAVPCLPKFMGDH